MIKRLYIHLLFGATCGLLCIALAIQTQRLYQHKQLSAALASIPDTVETLDAIDTSASTYHHPAVQLALASSLAKGGNLEQAERLFNSLARDESHEAINTGARFNLANAYLREALDNGSQSSSQTLPLIELAKQRYRDLLATSPDYWPARYNLERALRLAPEGSDKAINERIEPVKRVNVVVPGFEKIDLP